LPKEKEEDSPEVKANLAKMAAILLEKGKKKE